MGHYISSVLVVLSVLIYGNSCPGCCNELSLFTDFSLGSLVGAFDGASLSNLDGPGLDFTLSIVGSPVGA